MKSSSFCGRTNQRSASPRPRTTWRSHSSPRPIGVTSACAARLVTQAEILADLGRPDYGDPELSAWAEKLRQQNWSDVFVFFKHEDEAKGPKMAKRFLELAEQRKPVRQTAKKAKS